VPDISRARKLVGFEPQLGLDEIIESVIADRRARTTQFAPAYSR
jgi:nucleoside-diphosphate-sugar epimerase